MKAKRIRIWLSKGWYHIVYAFSFMLFSLLCSCSSSRAVSKEKAVEENDVETPDNKEVAESSKDETPVTINIEDFQGLGIRTPDIKLMYGVQRPEPLSK